MEYVEADDFNPKRIADDLFKRCKNAKSHADIDRSNRSHKTVSKHTKLKITFCSHTVAVGVGCIP